MKKSDLKRSLKPIIKECVNEILLEQGLLSSVISEVVRGLAPLHQQNLMAQKDTNRGELVEAQRKELDSQRRQLKQEQLRKLKEQKRKLLDAAGFQTNVFEGVEPLSRGGTPLSADGDTSQAGALAGVDPSDEGVDIAGIMALGGSNWKKMI